MTDQSDDLRRRTQRAEAERDQLAAEVKRLGATVLRLEGLRDQWLGYTLADVHGQAARLLGELNAALRPAAPPEEPVSDVAAAVLGAEWLRLYRTDPAAAASALAQMLPPGRTPAEPAAQEQTS
ncbi:hypothetical protein [Peterkaempfera sp. SMS 1(5)a]|uniref:hypothetical protein n=1 Tax=Peterkaempfera podocarpi TaxID=3232308 RepID=UPI00367323CB